MTRRFFSGKTLEQAVLAAARHYDVEPARLAYRQIEKRHGFLKTRKAVVISVDPELPTLGPDVAAAVGEPEPAATEAPLVAEPVATEGPLVADPVATEAPLVAEPVDTEAPLDAEPVGTEAPLDAEPVGTEAPLVAEPVVPPPAVVAPPEAVVEAVVEPVEPLPEPPPAMAPPAEHRDASPAEEAAAPEPATVADDEMLAAAERLTDRLLSFSGIDARASARSGAERIEIEVEGPDDAVLVVESGNGLLAIQHLLPRLLRGSLGRSSYVRVDSRDFHQNRRERLEALAIKEAEAASHSGSSRTLPPMAPDERRIVHLALKETPAVVTESRGTGLHKRIVIRPVVELDEHKDIEARHGF